MSFAESQFGPPNQPRVSGTELPMQDENPKLINILITQSKILVAVFQPFCYFNRTLIYNQEWQDVDKQNYTTISKLRVPLNSKLAFFNLFTSNPNYYRARLMKDCDLDSFISACHEIDQLFSLIRSSTNLTTFQRTIVTYFKNKLGYDIYSDKSIMETGMISDYLNLWRDLMNQESRQQES